MKRALSVLADNAAADVADDDVQRHAVVRVADEVVVDLMGRACGLSYDDAARDAETLERDGVPIPLASPATLIRTKDTRRPQDAIDRAFLEGVLRARTRRGTANRRGAIGPRSDRDLEPLATFKEFPPSQRPSSFSIDQVVERMRRSFETQ